MNRRGVMLTAALSVMVAGCSTVIPPNDAGDAAWVIDTLRVLHGRPPRSAGEVSALVRLARYNGRDAVVDLLLEDTELVDHWAEVLTDDLGVVRYGAARMDPACYDAPMLTPVDQLLLAEHLRVAGVSEPFCVPPLRLGEGVGDAGLDGPPWSSTRLAELGITPPPSERELAARVELARAAEAALDGPPVASSEEVAWGAPPADAGRLAGGGREQAFAVAERAERASSGPSGGGGDGPSGDPRRTSACPEFNMADVLRASILGKSLWIAWRAQMIPDMMFIDGYTNEYPERAAERFWLNTVGRDSGCLACHTSSYSTTEARPRNQSWDRFFPPTGPVSSLVDIEGSALSMGAPNGMVYGGFGESYYEVRRLFPPTLRSMSPSSALVPWGMANECVQFTSHYGFDPSTASGVGPILLGDELEAAPGGGIGFVNRFPSIIDGFSFASAPLVEPQPTVGSPAAGAGVYAANCAGCHGAPPAYPRAPDLADVVPGMTDRMLRRVIEHGSMSMTPDLLPNGPLSGAQIDDLIAYFRDPATGGMPFVGPRRYASGEDGLAHLIALNIVNRVVEDIQGQPLVLSHGFPRNAEAAAALDLLVRVFVESGWSLQSLLRWIVLTDMFNRAAPAETATAASGPLAYELPMLAHPWAADPPGSPPATGRDHNGTGDLVHRSNVSAMIRHVHEALGWPDAIPVSEGVASTTPFPWADLQRDLGRPDSFEATTGLPTMELANLLQWEQAVGTCVKPELVRAADVTLAPNAVVDAAGNVQDEEDWIDWIDVLVASAPSTTARDVARAIKSRLLAETELSRDEEGLIANLWGLSVLDASASAVTEAKMRQLCGVLLMSPDFLLRRMPAPADPPTPMAWEVCLEPECTEAAFCASYVPRLRALGYDRDCSNNVSEPGDEDDPTE